MFQTALKWCPKEERGSIYPTGEEEGACSHAYILQKFAAGLMKVTTSHRHQTSLKDFGVFLDGRRCKIWAHKNLLLKVS